MINSQSNKELLMVSVLPAHIAFEMKTEMLAKTRYAQMRSLMLDMNKNETARRGQHSNQSV
jgi:hypothetical protein